MNYFLFDESFYNQKCDIAVGTKAAPVLSNLVMVFVSSTLSELALHGFGIRQGLEVANKASEDYSWCIGDAYVKSHLG